MLTQRRKFQSSHGVQEYLNRVRLRVFNSHIRFAGGIECHSPMFYLELIENFPNLFRYQLSSIVRDYYFRSHRPGKYLPQDSKYSLSADHLHRKYFRLFAVVINHDQKLPAWLVIHRTLNVVGYLIPRFIGKRYWYQRGIVGLLCSV